MPAPVAAPPAGPDTADAARLRLVTLRLARRFRKHSGAEVTPSQLSALITLGRHGPLRVGRLAAREQISRSSVTRLAGRLEALGLVARTPDPDDARSAWIALSPDGRVLVDDYGRRADEDLARQLAALAPADRTVLRAALPVLEQLLGTPA